MPGTVQEILREVGAELMKATSCHGSFASAHEGYAVILEELDEVKAEVWKKSTERNRDNMRKELTQVAAMAVRMILDLDL